MNKLSTGARRVLKSMSDNKGFLSLAQARRNSEAVAELLDVNFLMAGTVESIDGYKLTRLAERSGSTSTQKAS